MLFHLVIALILPYIVLAEDSKQNETIKGCNYPEVIAAGDKYFECFEKDVHHILDKNYEPCSWRNYSEALSGFIILANKTCYHNPHDFERDGLEFYKLKQYSMKYGTFKGFVDDGGLECISAVKDDITRCVQDIVGIGPRNKYRSLWTQMGIYISKKSCEETGRLKKCTLEAIRNEGYYKCKYNTYIWLYVSSLFELLLERCIQLAKAPPAKSESSAFWEIDRCTLTTGILIGLVFVLVAIPLCYIAVRVYRTPGSRWKSLKEQFKMTG